MCHLAKKDNRTALYWAALHTSECTTRVPPFDIIDGLANASTLPVLTNRDNVSSRKESGPKVIDRHARISGLT